MEQGDRRPGLGAIARPAPSCSPSMRCQASVVRGGHRNADGCASPAFCLRRAKPNFPRATPSHPSRCRPTTADHHNVCRHRKVAKQPDPYQQHLHSIVRNPPFVPESMSLSCFRSHQIHLRRRPNQRAVLQRGDFANEICRKVRSPPSPECAQREHEQFSRSFLKTSWYHHPGAGTPRCKSSPPPRHPSRAGESQFVMRASHAMKRRSRSPGSSSLNIIRNVGRLAPATRLALQFRPPSMNDLQVFSPWRRQRLVAGVLQLHRDGLTRPAACFTQNSSPA